MITQIPSKHPTVCNLCGGKVIRTTNDNIYGRIYGNGICYMCLDCKAYVGTRKSGKAHGILADKPMREKKVIAHGLFDPIWKSKKVKRNQLYLVLSKKLGIGKELCHFGYFDEVMLDKAIQVLGTDNWWEQVEVE